MPKGNPIGSKSPVVKRRRSKKRSGFQGFPKWKKETEKGQPKDVCELFTFRFIPDSDVSPNSDKSETTNIPVSGSKWKLDEVEIDSERNISLKIPRNQQSVIILYILEV